MFLFTMGVSQSYLFIYLLPDVRVVVVCVCFDVHETGGGSGLCSAVCSAELVACTLSRLSVVVINNKVAWGFDWALSCVICLLMFHEVSFPFQGRPSSTIIQLS